MRNFFYRILLICMAVGCIPDARAQVSNSSSAKMTLNGTIGAYADSMWAAIIDPQTGSYVGSPARILQGTFKIITTIPSPTVYILMIGNPQEQATLKYFNCFFTNEATSLHVGVNQKDIIVSKGAAAMAFQGLIVQMGDEFDLLNQLTKMKESAGTFGYSADSIAKAREQVLAQLQQKIPTYLQQHGNSIVAPFLLNVVWPMNFPLATMESWIKMIPPAALDNQFGATLTEMVKVEKMLGYGQVAPVFTQNDPDGKPVSLAHFKGKYVLIDFWASWCGPCRQENPNVVKAHERFKSKNFTVLGVSLDRDKSKWLQAIDADNLDWTQVSDLGFWNNAVAKMYKVSSIPQNYLIDPDGRIIGKNLRGEELSAFLEKTLTNN